MDRDDRAGIVAFCVGGVTAILLMIFWKLCRILELLQ